MFYAISSIFVQYMDVRNQRSVPLHTFKNTILLKVASELLYIYMYVYYFELTNCICSAD